jgi:hypothetical protein
LPRGRTSARLRTRASGTSCSRGRLRVRQRAEAVRTDITVNDLAGTLAVIRDAIERAIPVGGPGIKGSWDQRGTTPARVLTVWEQEFEDAFARIPAKHPKIRQQPTVTQLGTLGTGNHFIEVCQDLEDGGIWFMLHSGSRGVGNRIGTYFIEQAKEQAFKLDRTVKTDVNLAWLDEGTALFDDYVEAVGWAQRYARRNRDLMMEQVVTAVRGVPAIPFRADLVTVSCHHNYVEEQGGLYLTRKGAVSAKLGELGIIPGSMGAKSFIVRGLGHPESFESCSHGAGRRMSRGRSGVSPIGAAELVVPGARPARLAPIPRSTRPSPHRLAGGSSHRCSRLPAELGAPTRAASGRPVPGRRRGPNRRGTPRKDRRRDRHSTGTRSPSRRRPHRQTRDRSSSRSHGIRGGDGSPRDGSHHGSHRGSHRGRLRHAGPRQRPGQRG